jgi:NTE family protein
MASGALPPAFAAVEVDGEYYWDGGLVSNTPLRWVVDGRPQRDTLVFQVDLWPAHGELPHNMAGVNTRQKEIMYSSRTRAASTRFIEAQALRNRRADLLGKLPPELANERTDPDKLRALVPEPLEIDAPIVKYELTTICAERCASCARVT